MRVLAPHKEQDGWVYCRVKTASVKNVENAPLENAMVLVNKSTLEVIHPDAINAAIGYTDDTKGSRVISSRRVEEAVETADYLKRCAEEGLTVCRSAFCGDSPDDLHWVVGQSWDYGPWGDKERQSKGSGATLREAYHRYKALCAVPDDPYPLARCRHCYHYDLSKLYGEPCFSCKRNYPAPWDNNPAWPHG